MVSQSLPLRTQGNLRQQGYRMETSFGWDTHTVPLYTHKAGTVAEVGEVAIRMRVGNLKSLDRAEAQYLAAKGAQGFFTWKPDECFEHEFTPVRYEERPGGGLVRVAEPKKLFGCKWCRAANPNKGLTGEAEQPIGPAAESAAAVESAPPATEGTRCTLCTYRVKPVSKAGKPLSVKLQLHLLKMHTNRKHA